MAVTLNIVYSKNQVASVDPLRTAVLVSVWASCQECPWWRVRLCLERWRASVLKRSAPCTDVNTSMKPLSSESSRRPVAFATTLLMVTWFDETPAALATALMKAVLMPPTSLLNELVVELSVTTAVIRLEYAHLYPWSHRQWRRDELPMTELVCVGQVLMVMELVQ